jgi:phosphatidylserine decarboxylase
MPLPPYLRVLFYKSFGVLYGVNFDEIKIKDLNQFRTWNQFFTRELEEGARVIVGENDEKTLVSPCDGKIMRIGQIDSDASSIACVKGNDYRLDEFLLGYKQ